MTFLLTLALNTATYRTRGKGGKGGEGQKKKRTAYGGTAGVVSDEEDEDGDEEVVVVVVVPLIPVPFLASVFSVVVGIDFRCNIESDCCCG